MGEYYAIAVGIRPKIYLSWEEACSMVDEYNFNWHKRFTDKWSVGWYLLAMAQSREVSDKNKARLRRAMEEMELRYVQLY